MTKLLNVGDKVGVAYAGSWGNVTSQGIYQVTKANKMFLTIARVTDGYERIFSVKTGVERGKSKYNSAFLEPVDHQEKRKQEQEVKNKLNSAWNAVESAALHQNVKELEVAYTALKQLLNK